MAQWVNDSFYSSYQNILCHFKTNVYRKTTRQRSYILLKIIDVALFLKEKWDEIGTLKGQNGRRYALYLAMHILCPISF